MLDTPIADRAGETVGDSAYRRIRNDVIFGTLEPGQKLKLEKMSVAYGTSVSTLRETLNRLCSEGFVVAEGQRGFEVTSISATEFQQIAELRELLEGPCHRAVFQIRRSRLGSAGGLGSSQAVRHGKGHAGWRQVEDRGLKQCDWQFLPRADRGLRLAGAARCAVGGLRQVSALPDAGSGVSRRGRRGRASRADEPPRWHGISREGAKTAAHPHP